MMAEYKVKLINECVRTSRMLPNKTIYGFIDKNNDTWIFGDAELPYLPKDIGRLYCKAKNGNLIL